MRYSILAVAMALTSPGHALENTLYSVNLGEIMSIATKALKEVFPDISSDQVTLANDVYVQCSSTRPEVSIYALEESFKPCEAQIVFDLSASSVEHLYLNRDGDCVRVMPPGSMFVSVFEDGSSKVAPHRGRDSELQVVECADEVITQLAAEPRRLPGHGKAFSVEPKPILELAFVAAVEENPNTPPEELDFQGMISLFCDVTVPTGGIPGWDVQIKPCRAELMFLDRASKLEEQYSQGRHGCFVGPSHEAVKVTVYPDRNTRVHRTEWGWSRVPCNDESQNSPLPFIDRSD